jgi:peroxiredoxin
MLTINQLAPQIKVKTISGEDLDLHGLKGKRVLLKFHRFSGCPVAQNEVSEFVKRQKELFSTGVETIVFLHNNKEKVLPVFQELPGFHLVADRQKLFYNIYHAQFSWKGIFSLATWRAIFSAFFNGYFPRITKFQGGIVGIPADFLLDENSRIVDVHYGRHFGDSWTVSEVLQKLN